MLLKLHQLDGKNSHNDIKIEHLDYQESKNSNNINSNSKNFKYL